MNGNVLQMAPMSDKHEASGVGDSDTGSHVGRNKRATFIEQLEHAGRALSEVCIKAGQQIILMNSKNPRIDTHEHY